MSGQCRSNETIAPQQVAVRLDREGDRTGCPRMNERVAIAIAPRSLAAFFEIKVNETTQPGASTLQRSHDRGRGRPT